MEQAAVAAAIGAAIQELKSQVEAQQTVLKAALDKEFDAIRKSSNDATEAVRETFVIAD